MAKCVREMGYWPDRRENKRHLGASFRAVKSALSWEEIRLALMLDIGSN
jgi:hypothetical protein